MLAPEYFKSFPRRTHTTFLYILNALSDSLSGICVGGDVKQTLMGFGILHDRFRLSIDCKNQRFLRLLEMLHELPGIAPECRHRLNVFFYVEHDALALP
jgi:hypothetical protein